MDMFTTGLTSITFRSRAPEEIIAMAAAAGLDGIEWGGDIHVPPADTDNSARIASLTRNAGLSVLSYGSYYRAGLPDSDVQRDFAPVLANACALGVDMIRVWPGKVGSAAATPEQRESVAAQLRVACDMAMEHGITLSTEYHRNSLTDTAESALRLVTEVDRANFATYWQPNPDLDIDANADELRRVIDHVTNVHVFHWVDGKRRPLEEGVDIWNRYLDILRASGKARSLILEFVQDDDPKIFAADAVTLRRLASSC